MRSKEFKGPLYAAFVGLSTVAHALCAQERAGDGTQRALELAAAAYVVKMDSAAIAAGSALDPLLLLSPSQHRAPWERDWGPKGSSRAWQTTTSHSESHLRSIAEILGTAVLAATSGQCKLDDIACRAAPHRGLLAFAPAFLKSADTAQILVHNWGQALSERTGAGTAARAVKWYYLTWHLKLARSATGWSVVEFRTTDVD